MTIKQIISIVGFIVMVIAIPLSFSLVKQTQIFKSSASQKQPEEVSTNLTPKKPVTKPKEIPSTSPLSELQKMLDASKTPASTSAEQSLNLAFGPTLNLNLTLEGRPTGKQAAKVFVGIAQGERVTSPKYLLTFSIDLPNNGLFKGLSLAGLNPGSVYTAYIKGPAQIDTAATFTMGPNESNLNNNQTLILLTGDLNEDNTVNSADYTIATGLFGKTAKSVGWNPLADFNLDGVVNSYDSAYILKNLNKTGTSGIWYSPPPAISTTQLETTPAQGSPSPEIKGISSFGDLLNLQLPSESTPSPQPTSAQYPSYWLLVPP